MNITKYQKFESIIIHRSKINFAYYNPRKISENSQKKLKEKIKKIGLLGGIIWNEQTGNLISGHQRLKVLDQLERSEDYFITVDKVIMDEKTEVEANIFLNNTSVMGEFDKEVLKDIQVEFPDIDFMEDLGFTQIDLDFFSIPYKQDFNIPKNNIPDFVNTPQLENPDVNKIHKESRDKYKDEINNTAGICAEPFRNDFYLTIVFPSNNTKWEFMKGINQKEKEKFIKYDDFIEFIKDDYRV